MGLGRCRCGLRDRRGGFDGRSNLDRRRFDDRGRCRCGLVDDGLGLDFLGNSLLGGDLLGRSLLGSNLLRLVGVFLGVSLLGGDLLGSSLLRRLLFFGLNVSLQPFPLGLSTNTVSLRLFH